METLLDRVEVKARCAPSTSVLRRLTSAPVCARVKKASDWRCTWPKTWVRRSKMSPSPMRVESQPDTIPNPMSTTATNAIAAASQTTSETFFSSTPSSMRRWVSSGVTTTSAASKTVNTRNALIRARWGPA